MYLKLGARIILTFGKENTRFLGRVKEKICVERSLPTLYWTRNVLEAEGEAQPS